MISTVSGELQEKTSFSELLRASLLMGSMTGAPMKRVLELIDDIEKPEVEYYRSCGNIIQIQSCFNV